jgi:23S rRNA (cytosine1962-C5)-methyltransferase
MAGLVIKPRARLYHGHEWVYGADVQKTFGSPQPGDVVSLKDFRDRPLGSAIYNPKSQIIARRFSRRKQELDAPFFLRRVQRAIAYREQIGRQPLQRLIWSESDGLPGVIVDQYGDHLVLQTLTMAMDQRKDLIVQALVEVVKPKSIIERNDAPIRVAEGLELQTSVLYGADPGRLRLTTPHGSFLVDLSAGQKTGLYLDQLENYAAVARWAKGRRVLDAFCNQGGFALACAQAGAASVLGLDASEPAIATATENAAAMGLADRVRFQEANVFDFLKSEEKAATLAKGPVTNSEEESDTAAGGKYDFIILDPPSFTKNKGSVRDALRGYKEIHLRALKLMRTGGILSTFSCSHHISRTEFMMMINESSVDAKRKLRLLSTHHQPADHPVLMGLPETEYLRGMTFELIGAW